MKKMRILTNPTKNTDVSFEEFDDGNDLWEQRIAITQARRRRALKHEVKGGRHEAR